MSYNIKFAGQFQLDKTLTLEQFNTLNDFASTSHGCYWVPTKDGKAITSNNDSLSFYDFGDWLVRLIEHFLKPWGYTLNGSVRWQGAEVNDTGTLICRGNAVTMLQDKDRMKQLEQVKTDLLTWAGLYRGNGINEEVIPRFHEIIDEFSVLIETTQKAG